MCSNTLRPEAYPVFSNYGLVARGGGVQQQQNNL